MKIFVIVVIVIGILFNVMMLLALCKISSIADDEYENYFQDDEIDWTKDT
jgi:hypothetical protein